MAVCQTACKNCDRKGLPILFTRYATAYTANHRTLLDQFAPTGQLQAKPGGISLKGSQYVVRMLRRGYLYVLVERAGGKTWSGYRAHPHGYLQQFILDAEPQDDQKKPCDPEIRGANASLVMVPDAKGVKNLWYLFHPDPVPFKKLEELKSNTASLQHLDLAGWMNGKQSQKDTCPPDQLRNQVLEWSALENPALQEILNDQWFGLMGMNQTEQEWGPYIRVERKRLGNSKGAPFFLKQIIPEPGQSYAEVHGKRLANIEATLRCTKGAAIVACHDGIGITQELAHAYAPAGQPYLDWLQMEQKVDMPSGEKLKISNEWKLMTSGMIKQFREGYVAQRVKARRQLEEERIGLNHALENARRDARVRQGQVMVPLPGGGQVSMPLAERERELRRAAEGHMASILDKPGGDAGKVFDSLYFSDERTRFDEKHSKDGYKPYQQRLKDSGEDHVAWLDSDLLRKSALSLYDRRYASRGVPTDVLGVRYMVQVGNAMQGLESSDAGKRWMMAGALLDDSDRNLLLTAISYNDPALRALLSRQLALVDRVLSPVTVAPSAADHAKKQAALGQAENFLKSIKAYLAQGDAMQALMSARDPLAHGAMGSLLSLLAGRAALTITAGPPSTWMAHVAQAQLMTLGCGLAGDAMKALEPHRKELNDRAQKVTKGVGAAFADIPPSEEQLQQRVKEIVGKRTAAALSLSRIGFVLTVIELLGVMTSVGKASTERNGRSWTEAGAQLLMLIGSAYSFKATVVEETFGTGLKQLAAQAATPSQRRNVSVLENSHVRKLRSFRMSAAAYLGLGAVIGIYFDLIDGRKAASEKDRALAIAYMSRSVAAGVSVGASVGMLFKPPPKLYRFLVRLNGAAAVAVALLTVIILVVTKSKLETWLNSCPFRNENTEGMHGNIDASIEALPGVMEELRI